MSFLAIVVTTATQAESRCQCDPENWQGNCQASVEFKNNWFEITSNSKRCSRVTWYIDGQPQTTIVVDGVESTEWLGAGDDPDITIKNCRVCKDRAYENVGIDESEGSKGHLDTVDLSGTWLVRVRGTTPDGIKAEKEERRILSTKGSNQYHVKNLGGTVRLFLGSQETHWTSGPCAVPGRKNDNPCEFKSSGRGQGTLTVSGPSARIVWEGAKNAVPDTLRILNRNRMEGTSDIGNRIEYIRISD